VLAKTEVLSVPGRLLIVSRQRISQAQGCESITTPVRLRFISWKER
jgi:hypothetical protein